MGGRGLLLGMLLLPVAMSGAEAAGCPCPKQKMVEMFGSISAPHNGPQKPPAVVTAEELAAARLARWDLPLTLPVRLAASDTIYRLVADQLAHHEQ